MNDCRIPTYVDKFNAVGSDGVEGGGCVFKHLMLVNRSEDVAQFSLLKYLDEGDQTDSVAQVGA